MLLLLCSTDVYVCNAVCVCMSYAALYTVHISIIHVRTYATHHSTGDSILYTFRRCRLLFLFLHGLDSAGMVVAVVLFGRERERVSWQPSVIVHVSFIYLFITLR